MLKVCKFGGSSLSDAQQFLKVKNIVLSDSSRHVVVVSALGKRNSNDYKITDLLYILKSHVKYSVSYTDIWELIYNRFVEIRNELNIDFNIEDELEKIKCGLKKEVSEDYLVSRGEYLTAKLMATYLNYTFLDSKDLVIFDYNGVLNESETQKRIEEAFSKNSKIVVPGFYGAYLNGDIKLMSRGGSDITGSIFANAIKASVYENFTDVSGILACDPKLIENPRSISEITYQELSELSYMGANVLHEDTVYPVQKLNIPINIKNTNDPENKGTLIKEECNDNSNLVTGITGKKNYASITIYKPHMSREIGFIRKVLTIFEEYRLSIDHIPSGIDSFSIVLPLDSINKIKYELIAKISKELSCDVQIDENLSLVAIVGRNMKNSIGVSGRIFKTLGSNDINIKMMDQDPLELSIIVGVKNEDYGKTIKLLYNELVA